MDLAENSNANGYNAGICTQIYLKWTVKVVSQSCTQRFLSQLKCIAFANRPYQGAARLHCSIKILLDALLSLAEHQQTPPMTQANPKSILSPKTPFCYYSIRGALPPVQIPFPISKTLTMFASVRTATSCSPPVPITIVNATPSRSSSSFTVSIPVFTLPWWWRSIIPCTALLSRSVRISCRVRRNVCVLVRCSRLWRTRERMSQVRWWRRQVARVAVSGRTLPARATRWLSAGWRASLIMVW